MAEEHDANQGAGTDGASSVAGDRPETLGGAFRRWWHAPALVSAAVLLLGAIVIAVATRPAPEFKPAVRLAERQIDRDEPEAAIETLNTRVYPHVADGSAPADIGRAYHTLLGRALYLGQLARRIDLRENNLSIMGEYHEAERRFADLDPRDVFFLADTYVRLGRYGDAFERAESLPSEEDDRRYKLIRRIVEAQMGPSEPDLASASRLLADLASRPDLPESEQLWALARQTEVRLRTGYPDEAIDRVLQEMPRLRGADPFGLGELHLLLARGYQQVSPPRLEESRRNLERAERLLDGAGGDLEGELHLLWARVLIRWQHQDESALDTARDHLASVTQRYRSTEAYLPALMLAGDVEARLGNHDAAFRSFERLRDELEVGKRGEGVTPESVAEQLIALHGRQRSAGAEQEALRYAKIAESLFGVNDTPPDVLLALAESNRAIAEALLPEDGTGRFDRDPLARLDPATRRLVAGHLRAAGAYFRGHADAVALVDNEAFGSSLWLAADAYDRAGERQAAIASFQFFVDSFAASERHAEARFRLGRAFQARAEFARAAEVYEQLIADRSDQFGPRGVGPYADASYVPLAQVYLLDDHTENDEEAETLLRQVVDGVVASVAPEHHRDALVELGRMRYRSGAHARAIERLEEAVARYPDDPELTDVKFLLADAYRKAAGDLRERLDTEPMPDSQRVAMENERESRLERAASLFREVRDGLEELDPRRRTASQTLDLQHSYYYLGDCRFDLGDYPEAIRYYNEARERYPQSPSSLVAMVQIVNCYVELGDLDRARTADERARRFYEQLEPSAFDDPTLPMTRRDWERWLESSGRLYALETAG